MFSPLASHSRLQKRQPRAKHAQRKPHAARKQHHAEPHERDWQHQAQHVQQPLRRARSRQRRDHRFQRAAAVERAPAADSRTRTASSGPPPPGIRARAGYKTAPRRWRGLPAPPRSCALAPSGRGAHRAAPAHRPPCVSRRPPRRTAPAPQHGPAHAPPRRAPDVRTSAAAAENTARQAGRLRPGGYRAKSGGASCGGEVKLWVIIIPIVHELGSAGAARSPCRSRRRARSSAPS